MATNVVDADEPSDEGGESKSPVPYNAPGSRTAQPTGFFTIYKKGQGKWTRLGTVFVAAGLGILTAFNLYQYVLPYLPVTLNNPDHDQHLREILLAVCVGFLAVIGVLIFWLGNKPRNVDFLIATDSEMKKVNWTTQGELFGSTRVVVLFLIFIGLFLSVVDLIFAEFFHLIRVLQ